MMSLLLAEMLEVLVLALTVMQEEASTFGPTTFGLQINWLKTKILQVPSSTSSSTVQVADGHVELVDAFVYLGCMIDSSGGSRREVLRRIGIAVLHEYVGEEDLEVKHQAGNQVTPLSDIHCASFDVWVRDLGHHKVPALSPRCI